MDWFVRRFVQSGIDLPDVAIVVEPEVGAVAMFIGNGTALKSSFGGGFRELRWVPNALGVGHLAIAVDVAPDPLSVRRLGHEILAALESTVIEGDAGDGNLRVFVFLVAIDLQKGFDLAAGDQEFSAVDVLDLALAEDAGHANIFGVFELLVGVGHKGSDVTVLGIIDLPMMIGVVKIGIRVGIDGAESAESETIAFPVQLAPPGVALQVDAMADTTIQAKSTLGDNDVALCVRADAHDGAESTR